MKIKLYPAFEDVFINDQLKGIFYPLCTIILKDVNQTQLHFVSHNGVWIDETYSTMNNNNIYTKFTLVDGKYQFDGNIDLYTGHEIIKDILEIIENDFTENGESYLMNKTKTKVYIYKIKSKLTPFKAFDFDLEYYLQVFYEFSINRLNYQLNDSFGMFRKVIDNWSTPNKSPIIHDIDDSLDEIKINAAYLLPENIQLEDYKEIGRVIGSEFFTDGNDNILLYNERDYSVLNINSYS
ncbi:MAG: hypothetical protein ACR2MS_00375 [Weeksellaceae bacterium]